MPKIANQLRGILIYVICVVLLQYQEPRKENKQKMTRKMITIVIVVISIIIINYGHRLQDIINEGLAFAVRSGDYHTSKQLLVLHTLVLSHGSRQQHQQLQLKGDDQNKLVI